MTYKEARDLSLVVKWKTRECGTRPRGECWCMLIEPKKKIVDDNGEEIYIVGSGCISRQHAEHIVRIHNKWVDKQKKL